MEYSLKLATYKAIYPTLENYDKININDPNINVFTYCSGKAGGSTLHTTFESNGFNSAHVHSNKYFQSITKTKDCTLFDVVDYCKNKNDKLYIIDSYRNPVERKISSFFENINALVPNHVDCTVDDLIFIFNSYFLNVLEDYQSINEILQYYKLPLFNSFNHKKKYASLTHENISFYKIRFSDIGQWKQILTTIFKKNIVIQSANLSKKKKIYKMYKKFKAKYTLPKDYLQVIQSDNDFKIFNNKKEQEDYLSYWSNKSHDVSLIDNYFPKLCK